MNKVGLHGLIFVENIAEENIPSVRTGQTPRPPDPTEAHMSVKISKGTYSRLNFLLMKTVKTLYENSLQWCEARKREVYIANQARFDKNTKFWTQMAGVIDGNQSFIHWLICPCQLSKGVDNYTMLQRFKYLVTHGYHIKHLVLYNLKALTRLLGGVNFVDSSIPLIPSISFLALNSGDNFNKQFGLRTAVLSEKP